jgi:ribonuclease HI
MNEVMVYTDGSARGNPGKGGYGVVMIAGSYKRELFQGFLCTTNNRMELLAVIVALEALKKPRTPVTIYSDSKYVVDSVEKRWVFNWSKMGFKGKKNVDLWNRFLVVYPLHSVKFVWVKGHAGTLYTERCDVLAFNAAEGGGLVVDQGYVASKKG